MTWRTLLAPFLAAVLLLQGAVGPARCLAALGPLSELASAPLCGIGGGETHHGPAHADHGCAVCSGLGLAVAPSPPAAPLRAITWHVAEAPPLAPTEGPPAPRAPPLLPRAPPAS